MKDRTVEEQERLIDKQLALKYAVCGVHKHDLFNSFCRARDPVSMSYRFEGTYSQVLVDCLGRKPDEEELIMLVHDSLSHDGATCIIRDNAFKGKVYV